jgi:methyl-accepting chemotaxis protein
MLKKFKLSTRIMALAVVIITCFILMLVFLYPQFVKKMYDAKYLKTRHLVESSWGVLDYYSKQAKAGALSADDAKKMAREVIKSLRYEQEDYFWINDMTPRMIMHPFKPELDGKELSENKDPNGKPLFMAMVEVCKRDGGGFVDYYWPKPGEPKPVPKISYVKLFPEWQWIIGSGIYIDDVEKELARMMYIIGFVVLGIALGALLLSFFMSLSITRPVYRVVEGLKETAIHVTSAAKDVAGTSQSLAESASEQAAAVEETSASLEQMAAMSKETSSLTLGAEELMNENIEKSGQSLKALVELTRNMSQIEADSDRISQIIKNIDEIAFQTNLLALNAAVEAARAGEAGAGFAVVADEVRNLAMRATEAAKSTQELLHGTIRRVAQAAKSIKEMNSAFEGIVESATVMGEKTAAITNVSREQAGGLEQVSKAVNEIDTATQNVAESAQSSAVASEALSEEVAKMKDFVDGLVGIVGGNMENLASMPLFGERNVQGAKGRIVKTTATVKTALPERPRIATGKTPGKAKRVSSDEVVRYDGEMEDF